jgi:prevent-host-death family protein
MTQTLSISEVRNALTRFPARFQKEPAAIEVTQRGRPVMALLPWDLYESLVETLEVMGDAKLMRALRTSAKQIKAGKTHSTEEVERRLGL